MSQTTPRTETTKLNDTDLNAVAGGVGAVDAGQKKRANGDKSLYCPVSIENQSGSNGESGPFPANK